MESTKYEYTRTTYAYHANYVRNSKSVAVLWVVFTVCLAILNVIIFIQPFWIGSTESSPKAGVFGLYRYWVEVDPSITVENQWKGIIHKLRQLDSFQTILSPYFKAATALIGISALLILLCVPCMLLLFFFLSSRNVFRLCSAIQFLSFLCLFAGCIVFAASWNNSTVKSVCGSTAEKFNLGHCELRWTYVLAIVSVVDALFLSILGFVLATKQVKMLPEAPVRSEPIPFVGAGTMYARGPIIAPIEPDKMSQFSATPSNKSRTRYTSSLRNLQL